MLHYIFPHRIQVGDHRRHMRPLLAQFTDGATERELHHLFVKLMYPLPHFLAQPRNLLDSLLKLFLEIIHLGFNQLLLLIG